ncbi:MAG: L-histidine N(alpha)-methyltransferase, partial [Myxococcales bacterium]|nr:L-histidine N(alpha)-methyltransferase [Myxococcales bacterium]
MGESRLLRPQGAGWGEQVGEGYVVHLDAPGDAHLAFAAAVVRGMEGRPRRLQPRFIYDQLGSELYEQITEQPEYYPTRTEDQILAACATDLAERVGQSALVELGSGSSTKTRRLLDAWRAAGSEVAYVPIDVSSSAVSGACIDLEARYPGLRLEGIASTFERGLAMVQHLRPKTLLFLGSTLGNLEPDEVDAFLRQVADSLAPGDHFLLGLDLAKAPEVLSPAYADAAGVTERFVLNVFGRMNRELGASLDLSAFSMSSFYDTERRRVEMWAQVLRDQQLTVEPLGRTFRLAGGDRILVEVSRKFTLDGIREEATRFDLRTEQVYTDPDERFAVVLLRREEDSGGWAEAVSPFAPAPRRPDAPPLGSWRLVPAGAALLGEPSAEREVAAVELGAAPVTCGEFRSFLDEGGYQDPQWWSEDGRRWRDANASEEGPLGWEQLEGGRWRVSGRPLDHMQPVAGVSYYEAEAYAAWSGARLPTEAECEKAASWDPE